MSRWSWLICAAVIAVTTAPGFARSTKVALAAFDGDNGDVSAAISAALGDSELEIVGPHKVHRAIERLGFDDAIEDRQLKKLAAELEVDAVVQGALDRRHHTLQLTAYAHGRKTKPFTLEVSDTRSGKFRKLARKTMLAKLHLVLPEAVEPEADAEEVAESKLRPKRDGEPGADADERGRSKATQRAKRDVEPDSDKDTAKSKATQRAKLDADPDDAAKPKAAHRTKRDAQSDGDADEHARSKAAQRTKRDAPSDGDIDEHARSKTAQRGKRDADPGTDTDDAAKPKTAQRAKRNADPGDTDDLAKPKAAPRTTSDDGATREASPRVAARDDDAPDASPQVVHTLASGDRTSPHTANRFAARLDIGASMTGRSLRFKSSITRNAPMPYQNAPVPGARFAAEVYPFAFGDPDRWLAGLGVGGDFDQALSLTLRTTAESSVALKTTQRRYSAGLRYRLVMGHTATSPSLTLSASYGARSFLVDRGGLMTASSLDLPDVDYRLVEPGVAFRLPLGRRLALELAGHALLARSAGPIQRPDQYGQASITGGDASASLDIVFGDRVALRLSGEATLLSFKFAGTGMLSTDRDGDPSTIDVRGATDRYLGGSATLAVLY